MSPRKQKAMHYLCGTYKSATRNEIEHMSRQPVAFSAADENELSKADLEAIAEAVYSRVELYLTLPKRVFDIEEAAKYIGLSVYGLRHKAGVEIPVVRIDAKLRFDRRDLDRYIDQAKRDGGMTQGADRPLSTGTRGKL